MGMNIKNPEAHRLARELAELTGESVTGAVTESLRERLERLRAEQREGVAVALLVVGRDAAKRMSRKLRQTDPDDLLYDSDGLPR
jgi:antitoxin VapB